MARGGDYKSDTEGNNFHRFLRHDSLPVILFNQNSFLYTNLHINSGSSNKFFTLAAILIIRSRSACSKDRHALGIAKTSQ